MPQTAIFFARAPPVVTEPELLELFEQFGEVAEINLFRRWATAKTSKGCGTVMYAEHSCAVAALEALDGKFQWDASETPMVVEWLDASRHNRATAAGTAKHTAGAGAGVKPCATAPSAPKARTPPSAATASAAHKDGGIQAQADAAAVKNKQQQQRHSYDGCSGAFCSDTWSSPLDACSWGPLANQANHVPVHVLPMGSSQMRNTTAPMANNAGSMYSPVPQIQPLLQAMWSASAPSSLLPDILHASSGLATDHEDWGVVSPTWNPSCSCNTSFTSIWVNDSRTPTGLRRGCGAAAFAPLPSATSGLTEGQLLLHDQAWQGSCYNSSTEPSFPAVPATCYALNGAPMCAMEDGASVYHSTELALDSLCSNVQAAADVTAAFSNSSLPGLALDAVPSFEWLQLQLQKQQLDEQQAQMSGAFAQHQPAPAIDGSSSSNLTPPGQQYIAMTNTSLTVSGCPQAELQLDITPQTVYAIGGAVDSIAKLSGAQLQINASTSGLKLRISGRCADVEAACQLIGVLLA